MPASVMIAAADAYASIPLLADRPARAMPTAYVCEHYACRAPVTSVDALRAQLDAAIGARAES